jgi:hypothetical protein
MLLLLLQTVPYVIGQVSAFTWCLNTDSKLFKMDGHIVQFARDASVLADREEQALYARLQMQRGVTLQVVERLRVTCLDLLSELMAWEDFRNATDAAVRREGRGVAGV